MGLRASNTRNLFEIVHKTFEFEGVWRDALGEPEEFGMWLIYGAEKHGKTTFALLMANMLSNHKRVLYVSGEQGMDVDFVSTVKRAKISPDNKAMFYLPYVTIPELKTRLKRKRDAEKVVFIDNTTTYMSELRATTIDKMCREFPDVLFIYLAHEDDDGAPATAIAKHIKKLAKRIFRIEGLTAISAGRVDGKRFIINEEKAVLYHGMHIA